jgi:2-(1,2-epoxy-1,2-dihydrophenyl)acetyl-CoA isomerase
MEFSTLLFDVSDYVATITLNRPKVRNAMNSQMAKDLMQTALRCDEDPSVRAVIITGSGKLFCSGGDLQEFSEAEDLPALLKEMAGYLHLAVSRLRRMDPPVIAAVNGTAAGAGMSLACCCDLIIASESARFMMAYPGIGFTPDGSSTYFLPRTVGLRRALEIALTNRMLSAQEAADFGLITRVVPDDQVLPEAGALAAKLAAGPTKALGTAKRLLESGLTESLETQMELEARGISDASRTADAREGIAAFLEKREAEFKGE